MEELCEEKGELLPIRFVPEVHTNGLTRKDRVEIVENPLGPSCDAGASGGPQKTLWQRRGSPGMPPPMAAVLPLAVICVIVIALCIVAVVLLSVHSCSSKLDEHPVCLSEHCVRTAASLLAAMDKSADPCVDFFQYACGSWNKMHRIPDDRSSINVFENLSDQLQVILKGVLEEPFNSEDNEATKKAKRFYHTCMDIGKREFFSSFQNLHHSQES
ncbi:hypothetical protein GE061_015893 [Apolygus lucorum]|uniref:Peptidase M13 N-terminal domain-containing protein n=1 Tax=Apolygus lucorum TaxID=248454 RepID=A0A8S9XME9_APOLU|nr:hypothetical protein GE061_015893 [Apolygus lucorum]